jgi:hypothetical protein
MGKWDLFQLHKGSTFENQFNLLRQQTKDKKNHMRISTDKEKAF